MVKLLPEMRCPVDRDVGRAHSPRRARRDGDDRPLTRVREADGDSAVGRVRDGYRVGAGTLGMTGTYTYVLRSSGRIVDLV